MATAKKATKKRATSTETPAAESKPKGQRGRKTGYVGKMTKVPDNPPKMHRDSDADKVWTLVRDGLTVETLRRKATEEYNIYTGKTLWLVRVWVQKGHLKVAQD